MAQYNRPPKVKTKGPDDFVSAMDHLVRYFQEHQNYFYVLVLAGLVALGGFGAYRWYVGKRLSAVATQYSEAESAPPAEAVAMWEKVLAEKPPRGVSHLAYMQIGGIQAEQNRWPEAAAAFQKSSGASDVVLHSVSQLATAIAYENADNCASATPIYQEIAQSEKNPFRFDAQLGTARCLVIGKKPNDAETILYQLISDKSEANPGVKSAAINELLAMKL